MSGFEGHSLSVMVFYLVPAKKVRDDLPPSVDVEEVLPGMTIGGFYASRHVMEQGFSSEFGVAPAFVRSEERKGFYLSRLVSDGSMGMGSGAGTGTSSRFYWREEPKAVTLTVEVDGREAVSMRIGIRQMRIPLITTVPFLMANEIVSGALPVYRAHHLRELHLSSVRVRIPDFSPLAIFPAGYKLASIVWEPGEVAVWEPRPAEGRLAVKPRIIEV